MKKRAFGYRESFLLLSSIEYAMNFLNSFMDGVTEEGRTQSTAARSHLFSVSFTADLCLYRTNLPQELRLLIKSFLCQEITQDSIHKAVQLWVHDNELALRLYGHISYWETSKVTDMSN